MIFHLILNILRQLIFLIALSILNLNVIILQMCLLINKILFSFLRKFFQIEKWLELVVFLLIFRMHHISSNSIGNCAVEPPMNQINIPIFLLRVNRSTILISCQMLLIYSRYHGNGQLIILITSRFNYLVLRLICACFVNVHKILAEFHILLLILHKLIFEFDQLIFGHLLSKKALRFVKKHLLSFKSFSLSLLVHLCCLQLSLGFL